MRSRVRTVCLLLCVLTAWLVTGCGHAAAPGASLARTQTALARARSQVQPYADALAAAVKRLRLSRSPVVLGAYRSCPAGQHLVAYNDTITVTADAPTTMATMSRQIAGILHSEGWHLVSVDFSKVHLALADTNHPLYGMSQHGVKGAANILPYGNDKAEALIFMHSTCIDAGSLAVQAEQGGKI
jgi:hypothetical protein